MIVFRQYLQHAHWVVKGDEAYMFHLLFERLYDSVSTMIDSYAEYLVGAGEGKAIPSIFSKIGAMSKIVPGSETEEEPLRAKLLAASVVLGQIAEMQGRDRAENKILDDIAECAATCKYLLGQSECVEGMESKEVKPADMPPPPAEMAIIIEGEATPKKEEAK